MHKNPYKYSFIEVFDQAYIHSTHKNAYTYQARSPELLRDSLLKKYKSDVDPQESKRIIRLGHTPFFFVKRRSDF